MKIVFCLKTEKISAITIAILTILTIAFYFIYQITCFYDFGGGFGFSQTTIALIAFIFSSIVELAMLLLNDAHISLNIVTTVIVLLQLAFNSFLFLLVDVNNAGVPGFRGVSIFVFYILIGVTSLLELIFNFKYHLLQYKRYECIKKDRKSITKMMFYRSFY